MTEPTSIPLDENQIIAERRAKLAEWRATGKAYPNDFERENISGKIIEVYDSKTGEEILLLMKRINRKFKTTFIFSTHDKRVIAKADRLVRVEDGEIALLGMRSHTKWSVARHRPSEAGTSNHDTSSQASEMSAAGGGNSNADQN